MGDNGDGGRINSIQSTGLSAEEVQSIQSLSSLSDSSLELPPQAGCVRVQRTRTVGATYPKRVPSTAFYVGAADKEEDDLSQNSSRFSLGLGKSDSSSQESSEPQDDEGSESSLMADRMEIAALIAKAKRGINADPDTTPQQKVESIPPAKMMGLNGSLLGRSPVQQKIPTKPVVVSPSPRKSSMAEFLETTKRKSSGVSIPREIVQTDQDQQESTTKLANREIASSPRSNWESSLSYPSSLETEKRKSGVMSVPRQSTESWNHKELVATTKLGHGETLPSNRSSRESSVSYSSSLETEKRKSFSRRQTVESRDQEKPTLRTKLDSRETEPLGKKKPVSTTESEIRETGSSQRLSWDSTLSPPYPLLKEKEASERPAKSQQFLESHRESSRYQSKTKEMEQRVSTATRESKRAATQLRERRPSTDEIMENARRALDRHTLATKEQKTKETETKRPPPSGSKRDERLNKIFQRYGSQPRRAKRQGRFSLGADHSSQREKEVECESRRHTWNGKKKKDKRAESVTDVKLKDRVPVSPTRKESREIISAQVEKKDDFVRPLSLSTQTERKGKEENKTMFIPKVDYRTISEKLKGSFNSGRQDKSASRISHESEQLDRRISVPSKNNERLSRRDFKLESRENENDNVLRGDYRLESREDSFDGERLLYVDHNRRSEMSSVTFKCRPLSEKARLMLLYKEKEKVANEFIAKWAMLSETATNGPSMRENGYNGKEPFNKLPPWSSRVSSLTHDFQPTGFKPKAPPNITERQLGSKKKRWVCDICEVANFESYAACFVHEKSCTGPVRMNTTIHYPPHREESWLLNE